MSDMRERLVDKAREFLAMREAGYSTAPESLIDAILTELQEPTPEMVDEGYYAIAGYDPNNIVDRADAKKIWDAMISAATKDGE